MTSRPSTEGVDVVATWALDLLGGRTDLSLAYNNNTTEVTRFNPATLNDTRIRQLEEGLPETRWSLTGNQDWGNWRALARVNYYDGWFDSEDGQVYDDNYTFDAEVGYTVQRCADRSSSVPRTCSIDYPDENPGAAAGAGNKYSQYTPFGFNGGFWYARLSLQLRLRTVAYRQRNTAVALPVAVTGERGLR